MSLVTFEETRPWAKAIKQRVETRTMPPWHLDRTVGIQHFKNDPSLTDAQIADTLAYARARYTDLPAWPGLEKAVGKARKESAEP